jgi:hypothetical protein
MDPYSYALSDLSGGFNPFYPFYQFPGGAVGIRFGDVPGRGLADAALNLNGVMGVAWHAELFLVAFLPGNPGGNVWFPSDPKAPLSDPNNPASPRLSAGISWGFTISVTATPGTGRVGAVGTGGVAGDANDVVNSTALDTGNEVVVSVGGSLVPVDKVALIAPYIGVVSILAAATVLAYLKRAKSKRTTDD